VTVFIRDADHQTDFAGQKIAESGHAAGLPVFVTSSERLGRRPSRL
jgi:hypothetical protein